MSIQTIGQKHGTVVRRATGFAADVGIALATDAVLAVRRVLDYAVGFGQGLLRQHDDAPSA